MTSDDWTFLLAGFGLQVGPFLAFTLWTLVPMSDRRVVAWFTAFGRLHPNGVSLVRERLVRIRWHRRIGALVGAVPAWAVSSWYGIVETTSAPDGVVLLPLLGYVLGAVLAELRSVRSPRGTVRSGELVPRRTGDYLARWVLPAAWLLVVASATLTLVEPLILADDATTRSVDGAAGGAAVMLVVWAGGLWCAHQVARAPLRRDPGIDPYLDDAFRQLSIVTSLAAASLLAVTSAGMLNVVSSVGWWAVPVLVPIVVVALMIWAAIRQPVPWTFGPRIRSAWIIGEERDASTGPSTATRLA